MIPKLWIATHFLLMSFAFSQPLAAVGQEKGRGQKPKHPIESLGEVTLERIPFEWPDDVKGASKIGNPEVVRLLSDIFPVAPENDPPSYTNHDQEVGDYTFATFDDGPPFLIAATDTARSTWIQEATLVRCSGLTCSFAVIHSDMPDFREQILDLKKDGTHQILVAESYSVGPRGGPGGRSLYIFGVSKGQVEDESSKFPEFYRTKLFPELDKEARELAPNEWLSKGMIEQARASYVYTIREMERRVLGDRTAGLTDAQVWEQSRNEGVRLYAVYTYQEIESPKADAGLIRLSRSGSKLTSEWARDAIALKQDMAANPKYYRRLR
jgi:hypothetical protein